MPPRQSINSKADYFQSNISLNKEIPEARAEVETARIDVKHIKDQMKHGVCAAHKRTIPSLRHCTSAGLCAVIRNGDWAAHESWLGVEAGTSIFILSTSRRFCDRERPAQMKSIQVGHQLRFAGRSEMGSMNARVTYIDPRLNEDTHR